MIVVKLISGLGNQLFQYAIGRQLALINNTTLQLNTSFYKNQKLREYRLNFCNIKASTISEEKVVDFFRLNTVSLPIKVYRKVVTVLPKYKRIYFKEKEWWTYTPSIFELPVNTYLDGYWQHYKYYENLYPEILKELTLKKEYKNSNSLLNEVIINKSSVSIHIRRGDYITDKDANQLMGVLPNEYYYKAIEYIKRILKDPLFYVFSDDLIWAKENLNLEGKTTYVDSGIDYLDLELMSSCSHNIIANSSFSWWGAFLNRNPNKIVIGPKNWVRQPEINKRIELLFPSWVKL